MTVCHPKLFYSLCYKENTQIRKVHSLVGCWKQGLWFITARRTSEKKPTDVIFYIPSCIYNCREAWSRRKFDPVSLDPRMILECGAVAEGIWHNNILIEVIWVGMAIALDLVENMMNWKNWCLFTIHGCKLDWGSVPKYVTWMVPPRLKGCS